MAKRARLTERGYAKHRGCALSTVQEARKAGRLSRSVTTDAKGRRRIDPALADAEWAATTLVDRIPLTGPTAPKGERSEQTPELAESRARREAAEAALSELKLEVQRGELVRVAEVDARLANEYARAKTKLLAVPSKARQRDPAFTVEQIELLGVLIREVLNDLASEEDPPALAVTA